MKPIISSGRRRAPSGRGKAFSPSQADRVAIDHEFNSATRLVAVDVETGGLKTHRPIIQIAAIAIDEDFHELDVFEVKIQFDEAKACPGSLRKIHYRRAEWKRSAVSPKTAAWAFARFLRRHATVEVFRRDLSVFRVAQLASHNSQFDGPFLTAWYERLGIFLPASYRVFCTLQRAYWLFQENPHLQWPDDFRLKTLCECLDVPLNPADAHEALADVRATIALLQAMARVCMSPTTERIQNKCPHK